SGVHVGPHPTMNHARSGQARSTSLFALLLVSGALAGSVGCSVASSENTQGGESQIVGGQVAAPGAYSWMTATFFGSEARGWYQGCGGSLIDSTHVLTAAHCSVDQKSLEETHQFMVSPSDPAGVRVALRPASIAAVKPADMIKVKKVYVHPGYDPSGVDNDV